MPATRTKKVSRVFIPVAQGDVQDFKMPQKSHACHGKPTELQKRTRQACENAPPLKRALPVPFSCETSRNFCAVRVTNKAKHLCANPGSNPGLTITVETPSVKTLPFFCTKNKTVQKMSSPYFPGFRHFLFCWGVHGGAI